MSQLTQILNSQGELVMHIVSEKPILAGAVDDRAADYGKVDVLVGKEVLSLYVPQRLLGDVRPPIVEQFKVEE